MTGTDFTFFHSLQIIPHFKVQKWREKSTPPYRLSGNFKLYVEGRSFSELELPNSVINLSITFRLFFGLFLKKITLYKISIEQLTPYSKSSRTAWHRDIGFSARENHYFSTAHRLFRLNIFKIAWTANIHMKKALGWSTPKQDLYWQHGLALEKL